MINSRFLDGMTIEQAKEEVAKRLESELRGNMPVAERQVNFRLRDWGISRRSQQAEIYLSLGNLPRNSLSRRFATSSFACSMVMPSRKRELIMRPSPS